MGGPRCESCCRFVSLEHGEPEVESIDIDDNGQVEMEVRMARLCAECGEEIREAELGLILQADIPDEYIDANKYTVTIDEPMLDMDERTEGKGRYMKTFFGVHGDADWHVHDENDEEVCAGTLHISIADGEEAAGNFEDIN